MTERNIFGNGPESKAESVFYLVVAFLIAMVWIVLKVLGWIEWITFVVLMVLPVLTAFLGLYGVVVFSDSDLK